MHYYSVSLLLSPAEAFFCLFFSIFTTHQGLSVDILPHHDAVACVSLFLFLFLFSQLTLSLFHPYQLVWLPTFFSGEIFSILERYNLVYYTTLLRPAEPFTSSFSLDIPRLVSRPWVRCSTIGHSLPLTERPRRPRLRHCGRGISSEGPISSAVHTETRRLHFFSS
jgi:hypothetical protein